MTRRKVLIAMLACAVSAGCSGDSGPPPRQVEGRFLLSDNPNQRVLVITHVANSSGYTQGPQSIPLKFDGTGPPDAYGHAQAYYKTDYDATLKKGETYNVRVERPRPGGLPPIVEYDRPNQTDAGYMRYTNYEE